MIRSGSTRSRITNEYLDGEAAMPAREADIAEPARILAIADAISAMLRPRPYRERIFASQALERLFVDDFQRYDRSILEALFWDLGFYPPGSLCSPRQPRTGGCRPEYAGPARQPGRRDTDRSGRASAAGTGSA